MLIVKKQYISICFLFYSLLLSAQNKDITIDLSYNKQLLLKVLHKKNKGVLIVTYNANNQNLYLHFIDSNLSEKWVIELKSEDYGFTDSYIDTKTVYLYFTNNYIYLLHNNFSISGKVNRSHLIQIDYLGNKKGEKINFPKQLIFEDYFLLNDTIYFLGKDKNSAIINKRTYLPIDPKSLALSEKSTSIKFPSYVDNLDIYVSKKGLFTFYTISAERNEDGSIDIFKLSTDLNAKLIYAKSHNIKLTTGYPSTDGYFHSFSSPALANLYEDESNGSFFVYGFIENFDNSRKKRGFYIKKYNSLGEEVFFKEYLFYDLIKHEDEIAELLKRSDLFSFLEINSVLNDLIFSIRVGDYENNKTICFLIQKDGFIKKATVFSPFRATIKSTNNNIFDIYSNEELKDSMIDFCDTESIYISKIQIEIEKILSDYGNEKEKPEINCFHYKTNSIIVEYFEGANKLILHKFTY